MARTKLAVAGVATIAMAAALAATEPLLPPVGSPISLVIVFVGFVYWMAGVSIYLNSTLHSSRGCLLLNTVALLLLCSITITHLRGFWGTELTSQYLAAFLPVLLARSYRVFSVRAGCLRRVERVLGGVALVLAVAVTVHAFAAPKTPWLPVAILIVIGAGLLADAVLLLALWLTEPDAVKRGQIRLVALGSLLQFPLFIAGSSLASDGWYWLWLLSSIILPVVVFVSVLRGQFMDVELQRSFIYLLLTVVLAGAYIAGLLAVSGSFSDQTEDVLTMSCVAVLSLVFVPLVRFVYRLTDHIVYGDFYDFRGLVSRVSSSIALLGDPEKLGEYICTHLDEALNLDWCALVSQSDGEAVVVYCTDPEARESARGHIEPDPPNVRRIKLEVAEHAVSEIVIALKRSRTRLRRVDEDLLVNLASQTGITLENYKLIDSLNDRIRILRESEASRRVLHRRLAQSEEETKAKLSRDLHDGPLQSLLHMVRLSESLTTQGVSAGDLEDISNIGRDTATELRQVCTDLRPQVLDLLDLPLALESLARRYENEYAVTVAVHVSESSFGLHRDVAKNTEVVLFRVAHEAMRNAFRHASATSIVIELNYDPERVSLAVRDDGIGFSVRERDLIPLSEASHIGVIGMFERIHDLDGEIHIEKIGGGGTELFAAVPLHRSGEEALV